MYKRQNKHLEAYYILSNLEHTIPAFRFSLRISILRCLLSLSIQKSEYLTSFNSRIEASRKWVEKQQPSPQIQNFVDFRKVLVKLAKYLKPISRKQSLLTQAKKIVESNPNILLKNILVEKMEEIQNVFPPEKH